ncbi:MAG: hypothetical protein L0Y58_09135 [Verrucomicrobia subdivision 3 bacterium]|nr:hypothetical protein [Limisphaerales bacterium]
MQFLESAGDPHARGIFGRTQGDADGAKVALLEKAKQDRGAIRCAEEVYRLVKQWCDAFEIVVMLDRFHQSGLTFAGPAPPFPPHGLGGDKARVAVQPPAKHGVARELLRVAREAGEDGLRDILSQLHITLDNAKSRGIDEINIARDKFTESGFRAVCDILAKQFLALGHLSLPVKPHTRVKPNKKGVQSPFPERVRRKGRLRIYWQSTFVP